MSTSIYIQCAAMYLLGAVLHLFVVKIPAVKKRDKAANIEFSFREYINQEWHIIAGNIALGCLLILGIDELANWKPEIMAAVKWFFAAVGAIGSVTIMSKFSTYEKKVLDIIDVKTNIGDAVTLDPVTKVSDVKEI
jgi:hypothetical protein